MRMPPSPPDWRQIITNKADTFFQAYGDPAYLSFVDECQRKYRHWDKVRYLARATELDPQVAWAGVALQRHSQSQRLPLCGGMDKPLFFRLPGIVNRHLSYIDQKLARSIGAPRQLATDSQREQIIDQALREEAIASSMLEGAATTRRIASEMLRSGRKPRTRGEQMVLNNHEAISFVCNHTATPMTVDLLLELQSILTKDTLDKPDEVGRLRRPGENIVVEDVRTGDVMHHPPPAEELAERLEVLCKFANDDTAGAEDDTFMHPVIRAMALHFQIGFDHPFCDGNGRTARVVFYWSMLRQGYTLFEYLPITRFIYRSPAEYQRAFLYTETDHFDLTYFLVHQLRIVREAILSLEEHLEKQLIKLRQQLLTPRPSEINDRQWAALQDLRHGTVDALTVQDYQTLYRVSYGTARNDLFDLEARSHIVRKKRGRQFQFVLTALTKH